MASNDKYIDNQKFLEALEQYKKDIRVAKRVGETKPPIPDYIGKCFFEIAYHLSLRPEFANYSYRDEMISDGIENCCNYLENFNPNAISKNKNGNNYGKKTKGPFPYFSQIIYFAFVRRIQKENKQKYIKLKVLEQHDILENLFPEDIQHITDESSTKSLTKTEIYDNMREFLEDYETKKKQKDKLKQKQKLQKLRTTSAGRR